MTKEKLAELLNSNNCLIEMSEALTQSAMENNLVVLYGIFENLIKVRGAIYSDLTCEGDYALALDGELYEIDETKEECYRGKEADVLLLSPGFGYDEISRLIRAEWCPHSRYPHVIWRITSNMPSAKFKSACYDDNMYSEGIVIDLSEVKRISSELM